MDTPRQQLAARIQEDNSGWIVHDYPVIPKQVRKDEPVVSVWRSAVVPAGRLHLSHELTLHVYGAKVIGAPAEAELDNILDAVLLSIERYEGCILGRVDRRQFANDAFGGFEISVSVYSANIYRSAVLQERSDNGSPSP
jgi:hypothetical protein